MILFLMAKPTKSIFKKIPKIAQTALKPPKLRIHNIFLLCDQSYLQTQYLMFFFFKKQVGLTKHLLGRIRFPGPARPWIWSSANFWPLSHHLKCTVVILIKQTCIVWDCDSKYPRHHERVTNINVILIFLARAL